MLCVVGNIAERVWGNGPADWTDPVCLDPSTKRHMERASDGRQPSDNVSRTDGVLGTLQSVGSALLESVSSMGSPQRPDPGLPPSAEQNALRPEQQQQPAEVHATNQPSGARPSMVDDSPCSCSVPVLAAAEGLQMPFASPALAGSSLTFSEQGTSPPSSSAPFGFPGYDSRSFAQSSEPPLPGFQPSTVPETPAYRTYQGGAVLQNGFAMPATPCQQQMSCHHNNHKPGVFQQLYECEARSLGTGLVCMTP